MRSGSVSQSIKVFLIPIMSLFYHDFSSSWNGACFSLSELWKISLLASSWFSMRSWCFFSLLIFIILLVSKVAFRALVGTGYQTLRSLLLDFCQWQPSEALLDALLDMLVDGKFDLKASPVIKVSSPKSCMCTDSNSSLLYLLQKNTIAAFVSSWF